MTPRSLSAENALNATPETCSQRATPSDWTRLISIESSATASFTENGVIPKSSAARTGATNHLHLDKQCNEPIRRHL